jgi:uncharacterized protein YegP (UPF0339 family)
MLPRVEILMKDATEAGPLAGWYERRIGEPTTQDEVTGYWLFVAGILVGILGAVVFFLTASQTVGRGLSYALLALAPPFLLLGAVIRFPLRRIGTVLSYLGFFLSVIAVVWFVSIFPGGWTTAAGNTGVIVLYGVGVFVIGIAGTIVPLLSDPLRAEHAQLQAAAAAGEEQLADARERNRALETEIEDLQSEIEAYRQSQARFELFEDRGGEYRWRLRHRNGNVLASSGQGYTRRHNAQKGMHSVKRNSLGAGVIEIEPDPDVDEPTPDDAADPVVAVPTEAAEIDVQATFELFEDNAGEYRWRLRHDNGNIIADSGEGYATESNATRSIDRLREYVGPADYLWFDPAGFEVYTDSAGQFRWRLVHRNGNILADSGEGYTRRNDASRAADRIRDRLDDLEFDVYEDNAGEYRWRLLSANGNIVADSGEGYESRSGAQNAVERLRELVPEADVLDIGRAAFEIYEDNAGEHRWRLRHRNGNILADSGEGYSDRSSARDAIESVKRNGAVAETERTA